MVVKQRNLLILLLLFCFQSQAQTGFEAQELIIKKYNSENNFPKVIEAYKVLLEENLAADSISDYSKNAGKLSKYYYKINAYDSACYYLRNQIEVLEKKGYGEKKESARLWSYLAVREVKRERFWEAEKAYLKAISIYDINKTIGNSPAYCHNQLSQVYQRYSDFTKSIAHLEEVLKIDTSHRYTASTYANLANAYYFMGEPNEVLFAYEQGLPYVEPNSYYSAYLNANAAPAFVEKKKFSEAEKMLIDAFRFFEKADKIENKLRCATELANLYNQWGKYKTAEEWYRNAVSITVKNKVAKRESAKCRYEYAMFLLEKEQISKDLEQLQSAIHFVWPKFTGEDFSDLPRYELGLQEAYAYLTIAGKGKALLSGQKLTIRTRYLAADCFDLALEVATAMRKSFSNEFDKVHLTKTHQEITQTATNNLYLLYLNTEGKEKEQIEERLYAWVEANRASALRDNLVQQKAIGTAVLPDSIRQEERSLRSELARINHSISTFEGVEVDLDSLKSVQLKLQLRYDAFFKELQNKYPAFQTLTHERAQLSLVEMQKKLPQNTLLLCYSDIGTGLLRITISNSEVQVDLLDYSSKQKEEIRYFVEHLSDREWQVKHQSELFELGHSIGQFLLPDYSSTKPKRLWIVPDGQLVFIPFETLLSESYAGAAFGSAPWIVRDFDVAYSWHPDLFFRAKNELNQSKNVHFAPFLRFKRDSLPLLANSGNDCPSAYFELPYEDEKANASTFFCKGEAAKIVHIATHAYANKGIEMADRLISIPELYGHRFEGDLLCLSACETGLGDLATGEGLLSMARAFAGSGSRSLVASLWTINDAWTAQIFNSFYTNLAKGEQLSTSLATAKRSFLQSDVLDPYKAPASWAALTLSGADDLIEIESNSSIWFIMLWILLGAFAAVGFLAFIRNAIFVSEKNALAIGILIAAFVYVVLALVGGQIEFMKIELLGVLLYGSLAYMGLKKHNYWLGIAWLLHPIWDIGLHLYGEGQGIAPSIYAWMCLSFDVIVAVYIFYFLKKNKKGNL